MDRGRRPRLTGRVVHSRAATLAFSAALAAATLTGCGGDSASETAHGRDDQPSGAPRKAAASPAPLRTTQTISASYSTGSEPTRDTKLAATPLRVELHAPAPDRTGTLGVHRKRGAKWARVKVRLRNVGRDPVEQSIASYLLVDAGGNRFVAVPLQVYKPAISCCGSGYEGDTMAPGDVATGYITFQLPQGAQPVKLRMTSPVSEDPRGVEWSLK
jgi:hypothetical protein